jgi:hypothetical protein
MSASAALRRIVLIVVAAPMRISALWRRCRSSPSMRRRFSSFALYWRAPDSVCGARSVPPQKTVASPSAIACNASSRRRGAW